MGFCIFKKAFEFQSLLWWNTSENNTTPVRIGPNVQGFNPCCGGIPLRIRGGRKRVLRLCEGFNPCCGGIPLRIKKGSREWEYWVNLVFQSLLWWNTSENSLGPVAFRYSSFTFQSLLWWNTSENLAGIIGGFGDLHVVSILVVVEYL